MANMNNIVRVLKKERDRLTNQLQGVSAALSAFSAAYGNHNGSRRKLSASARERIAEAQRQRWVEAKSGQAKSGPGAPKKRRTLSAVARKKIGAAQRARWAKVKASQKTVAK
jgi:hypothetical protein